MRTLKEKLLDHLPVLLVIVMLGIFVPAVDVLFCEKPRFSIWVPLGFGCFFLLYIGYIIVRHLRDR